MVLILFVLILYFNVLKDWNLIYVAMILLLSVYDCKFLAGYYYYYYYYREDII